MLASFDAAVVAMSSSRTTLSVTDDDSADKSCYSRKILLPSLPRKLVQRTRSSITIEPARGGQFVSTDAVWSITTRDQVPGHRALEHKSDSLETMFHERNSPKSRLLYFEHLTIDVFIACVKAMVSMDKRSDKSEDRNAYTYS